MFAVVMTAVMTIERPGLPSVPREGVEARAEHGGQKEDGVPEYVVGNHREISFVSAENDGYLLWKEHTGGADGGEYHDVREQRVHEHLICAVDIAASEPDRRDGPAADVEECHNCPDNIHERHREADRAEGVRTDAVSDEHSVDDRQYEEAEIADHRRNDILCEIFSLFVQINF